MSDDSGRKEPGSRGEEAVGDDAELRRDFQALRARVRAQGEVPDFQAMLDRAGAEAEADAGAGAGRLDAGEARPRAPRLARWMPLAAAAAVAAVFLVGRPASDGDTEFERLVADYSTTLGSYRSPTASLMEIPGVDLGAVPTFGGSLGGADLLDTNAPEGRDS